jgi:hypothetical protein
MTYEELKQLVLDHRKAVYDTAYLNAQLDHKVFSPPSEAHKQNLKFLELTKKRDTATRELLLAIQKLVLNGDR